MALEKQDEVEFNVFTGGVLKLIFNSGAAFAEGHCLLAAVERRRKMEGEQRVQETSNSKTS